MIFTFGFFLARLCSMPKSLGQGSNLRYSSPQSHRSDTTRSLTHWATKELLLLNFEGSGYCSCTVMLQRRKQMPLWRFILGVWSVLCRSLRGFSSFLLVGNFPVDVAGGEVSFFIRCPEESVGCDNIDSHVFELWEFLGVRFYLSVHFSLIFLLFSGVSSSWGSLPPSHFLIFYFLF